MSMDGYFARKRLSSFLRRAFFMPRGLFRNERGATAIYVAAIIGLLVGAVGIATDTSRGYLMKARLMQALDAAGLAGAKQMLSSNRDSVITMYFKANFPDGYMGAEIYGPFIKVNDDNTKLTLSASAKLPTTFMRIFGHDMMEVGASSEITRDLTGLDVVVSLDISGSMCQPCSKIDAAQAASEEMLNILYGARTTSPTITVEGVSYNLLNVGVVPWNSKVKVMQWKQSYNSAQTKTITVPTFTNPVTGVSQNVVYQANNTPVPLLDKPASDWKGCVYARYVDDGDQSNDADMDLGLVTKNKKDWMGWEPIKTSEGESVSGSWGPGVGLNWVGRARNCAQSYWNDTLADPDHPSPISNAPSYWHQAIPPFGNAFSSYDCSDCPAYGILPLQPDKTVAEGIINALYPSGSTDINQGLFWAWEVLMPEAPFSEAKDRVPYPRQRAIVLMTDGENNGSNGDAYKGVFGQGTGAGTNTSHGYMSGSSSLPNNLNNRLLQLASNIKDSGVKLYIVQFDNPDKATADLLKAVASGPDKPYYWYAPTEADLHTAFQEIGNNLSSLRISK